MLDHSAPTLPAFDNELSDTAAHVYVALDLETTGLKADKDEIIEIGAVRFTADGRDVRVLDRFVSFVHPGRPIPLRIQQITGINDGDVANAPRIDDVLPELRAFIGIDVRGVIAHNASFDLGFLRAAGLDVQQPAFDTFELASILMPGRASYNLGELCRNEGIALVDAHRAFDDAEACAQLFARLLDRVHGLPAPTLRALVESSSRSEASWSPQILFEGALNGALGDVAEPDDFERPVDDAFPDDLARDALGDGAATIDERRKVTPVEPAALANFFGEAGYLARAMGAAFERRDGQAEMAAQVLDSLNRGDHLLIEAGTGTGKSLAYLLPSALWSVQNGRRVVVATYTLALQEQLIESEVPRLLDLLASAGRELPEVALLKGRSHYLCTRRFARWREQIDARAKGPAKLELRVLAKVLVWLLFTETGDVNELFLPTDAEQAIWQQICSHAACNAQRCTAPADDPATTSGLGAHHCDFAVAAREAATRAHLLIINHALLFADLAAGRRVLPAFSHLIVDEAHHLEDAATDQLTFSARWSRAAGLLGRLANKGTLHGALHGLLDADVRRGEMRAVGAALTLADLGVEVGQALDLLPAFNGRLLRFAAHQKGRRRDTKYNQRLALDEAVRVQPEWSRVEIEWDHLAGRLRTVADLAEGLRRSLVESGWHKREPASTHLAELEATAGDLQEFTRRLDQIILQTTSGAGGASPNNAIFFRTLFDLPPTDEAAALTKSPKLPSSARGKLADQAPSERSNNLDPANPITNYRSPTSSSPLDREPTVAWLESNQRTEEATLLLAPRRVGSLLEQALVHDMRTAIFTGATLRTADGFGFTRDRLGLWEVEATTVDSPFEYETNTLLYLPNDMPPPNSSGYQQAVERAVIEAALAASGRTLVLFTSYSQLRTTAAAIRQPLDALGITVLQHGASSRSRVLREYRAAERAVLLGTRSFWEGIDLPGDLLRCLLIVKLPFAVPGDPLVAARSAELDNAFRDYTLPDAILRFRQGFGRLMRRVDDYGAVVLLDSRLWQKQYGSAFLESLPTCHTRRAPLAEMGEEVGRWLVERTG